MLVTLGDDPWPEARDMLLQQIDSQGDFLKGAKLAIDVGSRIIKAADMGQLRDNLSEKNLALWAVISSSPVTEQTAQVLGLATRISRPPAERSIRPVDTTVNSGEQAIFVRRTLRSGFSLQHTGSVIVVGDVNPGAEIIAGGNVLVWGKLRGVVHAGAQGDDKAIVCALELAPTQLRIAGQIAVTPQKRGKPAPEMARLQDGMVIAEPWNPKDR